VFVAAVHFWAPTFKWGISIANIADMQRPAEKVSTPQQCGECGCEVLQTNVLAYSTAGGSKHMKMGCGCG
jgi:hypothetical protein